MVNERAIKIVPIMTCMDLLGTISTVLGIFQYLDVISSKDFISTRSAISYNTKN